MRRAATITLTPFERTQLESWLVLRPPSPRLAVRAQIVLEAANGLANGEIARRLRVHPETVGRWRQRYAIVGLEGIRRDAPRGGLRTISASILADRIVRATVERRAAGGPPWTTRTLARTLGVNHMLVHRVWAARGLAPARAGDSRSEARPADVSSAPKRVELLGLYVGRPASAVVFGLGSRSADPAPSAEPSSDIDLSHGYEVPEDPQPSSVLLELLSRVEQTQPPPFVGPGRPVQELLVFLRRVDETAGPLLTELRVIFDRPFEVLPERVLAWLLVHPRLRASSPAPGVGWSGEAQSWLTSVARTPLSPESVSDVRVLAERAMRSELRHRSFSWTPSSAAALIQTPSGPRPTARRAGPSS